MNEYNEEVDFVWTPLAEEKVAIYYGSGSERRQAAMEQGSQTATFEMLSNTRTRGLTIRDRIVHEGSNWDITELAPDTPRRGMVRAVATRAA